jgi:hypothetical protein
VLEIHEVKKIQRVIARDNFESATIIEKFKVLRKFRAKILCV